MYSNFRMGGCRLMGMTDLEFNVELCNRAIEAHKKLLAVQIEVLRLDAERRGLELTVKSLDRQIELITYRDSLQEAA